MVEKNYITPSEQMLWNYIEDKDIADSELASMIFPDMEPNKRDKILHGLWKKGYLGRAMKGLYFNPERLGSAYGIALRMHAGYIGLGSALSFHGLSDYESFNVEVMTKSFRGKSHLEGTQYTIEFIPLGELFVGFKKEGGIYVSTLEKTLFDCLLRPTGVGFANISKALNEAEPDWREFLGFFNMAGNSALMQRTGYILGLLQDEAGKKVPRYVFDELHDGVKTPTMLAPGKGGEYDNHWKVQDNVGKERILPWIYGS
jgi:predicted transcriptional regulator of viral defense system